MGWPGLNLQVNIPRWLEKAFRFTVTTLLENAFITDETPSLPHAWVVGSLFFLCRTNPHQFAQKCLLPDENVVLENGPPPIIL